MRWMRRERLDRLPRYAAGSVSSLRVPRKAEDAEVCAELGKSCGAFFGPYKISKILLNPASVASQPLLPDPDPVLQHLRQG